MRLTAQERTFIEPTIGGRHWLIGCLTLLCVFLSSATSMAQEETTAAELGEQAMERYTAGNIEEAISLFREALELISEPAFAYNLAFIYDEIGVLPQAYQYYGVYLDLYPGAPNHEEVDARLAEIEDVMQREYALLMVSSTPDGAEIIVEAGGRTESYGPTPASGYVPPGATTIHAELDGFESTVIQRNAVAGVRLEVSATQLVLVLIEVADVIDDPDERDGDAVVPVVTDGVHWSAIVGWSLIGVGTAATVVGVVFWLDANSSVDEYDAMRQQIGQEDVAFTRDEFNNLRTDALDSASLGNILFGIGVAAMIGGTAVLIFVDSAPPSNVEPSAETTTRLPVPTLYPRGVGFSWGGSF